MFDRADRECPAFVLISTVDYIIEHPISGGFLLYVNWMVGMVVHRRPIPTLFRCESPAVLQAGLRVFRNVEYIALLEATPMKAMIRCSGLLSSHHNENP
jgi:hypothetical protein